MRHLLLIIAILLYAPRSIANEGCWVQGRVWLFNSFVPGIGVRVDGGPWHYTDKLGWYSFPVCSGPHILETHWWYSPAFDDSVTFSVVPRGTHTEEFFFPKGK